MATAAEVFEIPPDHHGTEVHSDPADRGLAEGQFNGHVGALDPSAVELRRQEEGIPRLGRDDGVLLFQFVVRRDNAEIGPGDVDAVDLPAPAEDARGIKPTGGAVGVESADGLPGPAGAGKVCRGDGKVGVQGEGAEFSIDLECVADRIGQHALELWSGDPSGEKSREQNAGRHVSGKAEHGEHEGEREEAVADFHRGRGVGAAEPDLPGAGERATRSGCDRSATI